MNGIRAGRHPVAIAAALGLLAGLLLAAAVAPRIGATMRSAETVDSYAALDERLGRCMDRAIAATGGQTDLAKYAEVWRLCQNQLYDQLLLNDFAIRRHKFQENGFDERVNLWLVVAITLSGVVLSAIQLAMSYSLAKIAKSELAGGNELAIEQGKLSLKSSVTGLLMMALSLAFFVVYVKWIYQNYDIATQKPDNLSVPLQGRLIPGGSLGSATEKKP